MQSVADLNIVDAARAIEDLHATLHPRLLGLQERSPSALLVTEESRKRGSGSKDPQLTSIFLPADLPKLQESIHHCLGGFMTAAFAAHAQTEAQAE